MKSLLNVEMYNHKTGKCLYPVVELDSAINPDKFIQEVIVTERVKIDIIVDKSVKRFEVIESNSSSGTKIAFYAKSYTQLKKYIKHWYDFVIELPKKEEVL